MSEDKIIATSGNQGNLLVFSLSEYERVPTFDVRKYYKDRKSGELKPTRKGITLTHKTFEVLRNVVEEEGDNIRKWLEKDDEFLDQVKAELREREKAGHAVRYQASNYSVCSQKWKSPEFFKVDGEGGTDALVFNEHHTLCEILNGIKDQNSNGGGGTDNDGMPEMLLAIIEKILLSFGRARALYDDGPTGEMNMVLDSLAVNWGIILKNYLEVE